MQGRDAELGTLLQVFESLRTEPRLTVISVVAEAGLGKSRLLQAFNDVCMAWPEARFCYRGRALPTTQDQAFGLLRDILATYCGWTDRDTPESTRSRFEQALQPIFGPLDSGDAASAPVHRLGYLVGLGYGDSPQVRSIRGDPRQVRQCGLDAALRLFTRPGGSSAAAVMQIEDLHWADNESLDFLQQLPDAHPQLPMLMLCSTRPALFERRPQWGSATRPDGADGPAAPHRRLTLAPLDAAASQDLADALLSNLATIPPALRELVVGRSGGHPFHMEQLVGLLVDAGALRITDQDWVVDADRLLATPWPATLTGVLQARLAALPAPQRRALQQASVIGPVFSGRAMLALGGPTSLLLPGSLTRELSLNGPADGTPDEQPRGREFSFRHQALQEVVYRSLPTRSRRALHKRLALWFAALVGPLNGHAMGTAATHFEQAGEAARAAEHHAQAAEQAADRYAHEAALAHVQRALALLDAQPAAPGHAALRWRLLDRRELIYQTMARRSDQSVALQALIAAAESMADDRLRAEAASRLSNLCGHLGDYAGQQAASRRAMSLAEQAGDRPRYLRAMRELAESHCKLGDWDAGQRVAQQCLALAEGVPFVQAQCLNTLAKVAGRRLDPVGRLHLHERELVLRKQLDDRRPEAVALANLGTGWLELGELFLARQYSEQALRLFRAMGYRLGECGVLCTLSKLERWLGDGVQALTQANAAAAAATDARSMPWQAWAMIDVGDCQLALGQYAAATQTYAQAQAMAIELKEPLQHDAIAGLARVALVQGDFTTAMQHVQRVLDHEAATGLGHGAESPLRVDLVCHLVLAAVGDPRAPAWLERTHGQLQAMAVRISDLALRRGFLGNIPEHRAVTTAWAVAQEEAAESEGIPPPLSSRD